MVREVVELGLTVVLGMLAAAVGAERGAVRQAREGRPERDRGADVLDDVPDVAVRELHVPGDVAAVRPGAEDRGRHGPAGGRDHGPGVEEGRAIEPAERAIERPGAADLVAPARDPL